MNYMLTYILHTSLNRAAFLLSRSRKTLSGFRFVATVDGTIGTDPLTQTNYYAITTCYRFGRLLSDHSLALCLFRIIHILHYVCFLGVLFAIVRGLVIIQIC